MVMNAMEPERLVSDLESATRATRQLEKSMRSIKRSSLRIGLVQNMSLGYPRADDTCEVVGDHVSLTRSRHRCLTPQLDDDTRTYPHPRPVQHASKARIRGKSAECGGEEVEGTSTHR